MPFGGIMEINLDDLKKLESSSVTPTLAIEEGFVEAIIKVNQPNYVPKNVNVRAQIDPQIFTCEISAKQLTDLENDPQVVSIAVSKKLHVSARI